MGNTCLKTQKLQNFCAILGEQSEAEGPLWRNFPSSLKRFQSNILQSNNKETSKLPTIYIFERSNPIL